MLKSKLSLFFFCTVLYTHNITYGRNIHRALEPNLPSMTVYKDNNQQQKYTLTDSHIRRFPLFEAYNPKYLNSKKLPSGKISYRNQAKKTVSGTELSNLIEELVKKVLKGQKRFAGFTVLKKKDFNFKTKCGLIVLKFNNYPFVVKIFSETPRSITKPYSKGLFPMGMFVMGGSNRHLNGFTRIKNSVDIKEKIAKHPEWSNKLSVPRKWFWLPKQPSWLHITTHNVAGTKEEKTKIPAIYALIADEIVAADDQKDKNVNNCLAICRYLEFVTDPHYSNFRIEKGTNKLVLYDTEHFPTLIGKYSKKMRPTQKYVGWYARLARKFIKEKAFSSKKSRHMRQINKSVYPLY